MLRRRRAWDVVGEDGAEARARLDPRIPFLGRLMRIPRDVAQIVERREMGRRGDVREREMIAREPAPPLAEIADVIEVVAEIGLAGADRGGVGFAESQEALHDLLADEIL